MAGQNGEGDCPESHTVIEHGMEGRDATGARATLMRRLPLGEVAQPRERCRYTARGAVADQSMTLCPQRRAVSRHLVRIEHGTRQRRQPGVDVETECGDG